jgi:outer membrane protein TolC
MAFGERPARERMFMLRAGMALFVILLSGCHHGLDGPSYYHASPARALAAALGEEAPLEADIAHIQPPPSDSADPRPAASPVPGDVWQLSREDALAVAIGNARIVRTLSGPNATLPAATTYDAAIAETQVQSALAAFDANLALSTLWERQDNPPGLSFHGFETRAQQLDLASSNLGLVKPFVTGTRTRIDLNTNYLLSPFDPTTGQGGVAQYNPRLEFGLSQPLLQGAGICFNRAPLLLARATTDQSVWEFQQALMALVRDVESTYWELYAAQVQKEAIDRVFPLVSEVVRIQREQLAANYAAPPDVAQSEAELESYRRQGLQAANFVLERQMVLRNLLGLPPADCRVIVAIDRPFDGCVLPDWKQVLAEALVQRPDVVQQRLAVRIQELDLVQASNSLLPRLDLQALWRINGLGNDLSSAFDQLSANQYTDWQLGFELEVPLHNHAGVARTRAARLSLARQRLLLRNTVHSAAHELAALVRDVDSLHQQFAAARQRQRYAERWAEGSRVRYENPRAGVELLPLLDNYLRSLDAAVTAKAEAARVLAEYNSALVRLEEAQGILLRNRHVEVQDPVTARLCATLLDRPSRADIDLPEIEELFDLSPQGAAADSPGN